MFIYCWLTRTPISGCKVLSGRKAGSLFSDLNMRMLFGFLALAYAVALNF